MSVPDPVWTGLHELAAAGLVHYPVGRDAVLTPLAVSENATFRVDDPATGARAVLRLHRPGYHTRAGIDSELAWVRALRDDAVVATAAVLPTSDGQLVACAEAGDGRTRHVVMFEFLDGHHPPEEGLTAGAFQFLGALAARMHRHARGWPRPPGFTRLSWTWETMVGEGGHWGRWRDGPGVGTAEQAVLGAASDLARRRLADFGAGPDRVGLVHADMRLANLLVAGDRVQVIDFDDCGFGWYLWDLAASLSFIEHRPEVPALIDAWLYGYRTETPLSAREEREIPTFVLLRRLLLVAWMGSHGHASEARELGLQFTEGSCELAEAYLSRFS